MRIGIMCLDSFGGSARIATQLAAQLSLRGHRIHLFTRTTPFGDSFDTSGLNLHTVKPNREADLHPADLFTDWSEQDLQTFLVNVSNVIDGEGLDVLHFHYAVPFSFIASEVKRRLGRHAPKLVGTLHGTDVSFYGLIPSKLTHLANCLSHIDKLSTVSQSHAGLATEVFALPTPPRVIPNFVDLDRFRPLPKAARAVDDGLTGQSQGLRNQVRHLGALGRPRIAHVSNFRPVKDAQTMARIFIGIRSRIDAELWLIGDGPELKAVRSILERSDYRDDIVYCGLQSDVSMLLARADLLLMTSLSESFCLAALEAMACGVPVLASHVGGLPEVVMHGKTGLLYPVGEEELAVRMAVNLLTDPDRHRAMTVAAVRHVKKFSRARVVDAYEELYRGLLPSLSIDFACQAASN